MNVEKKTKSNIAKMNSTKKNRLTDNEYLFYSNKSLVIYEIIKNISIEFVLVGGLYLLYFLYSNKIFLALLILVVLGTSFDILWAFRTVKYSQLIIDKDLLTIQRGNFFKRRYMVPIRNIYMITIKNNILLDKLNIVELKIRTLAENHSFNGLSKEDYNTCINILSKNSAIQYECGDQDE